MLPHQRQQQPREALQPIDTDPIDNNCSFSENLRRSVCWNPLSNRAGTSQTSVQNYQPSRLVNFMYLCHLTFRRIDIKRVREIASQLTDIEEISFNERSKVISFRKVPSGCRINVYTTGTVGTSLNHPHSGKTQLFRRNVTYTSLEAIMMNPRIHTGGGYFRNDQHHPVGSKRTNSQVNDSDSEVEDEEVELDKQLSVLQPQVDVILAQLKTLEEKKLAET